MSADASVTRMVQREIGRRLVDSTLLDIKVMHGVCYVRGYMKKLRTAPNIDLKAEGEIIIRILRQKQGIRDVIWDVQVQSG